MSLETQLAETSDLIASLAAELRRVTTPVVPKAYTLTDAAAALAVDIEVGWP